ncbi:MAG: restriction endonuclease, partial [Prevotella stercorea]|nr:restriction endonuclease [Leyella stercorea]MDY5553347.1 restriction endonuclease [Prevotella sp.]
HAGTPDRNGQYRVLSALALLQPQCVCTQSYLVAGAYTTAEEADNLLTYLKTKFVRYLILQTITSQDLSPEKFMFVPLQDFTSKSDINWSATVEEIDKQLYEKYGVDEAERSLIENTIKEM